MEAKSICVGLIGFVFIQVINNVNSLPDPDSDANTIKDLCDLPGKVTPLIPWGSELTKNISAANNDAAEVKTQLEGSCQQIKDGSLSATDKLSLANRLEDFGSFVRLVFSEMQSISKEAQPVVDSFYDLSEDLKKLIKVTK
ncbi:uncharacterized protein [Periplaneta americana]|uniref:uncharacterized protein n=1 Tax=Periplaneta americana TaxID=6978 RepID=UPI0037E8AC4B